MSHLVLYGHFWSHHARQKESALSRKPTAIAHVNLRIREHLRRKLETAALRRRVSLNSEMQERLEASFQAKAVWDIWRIAEQLERNWLRLAATEELLALGDAMATLIAQGASAESLGQQARDWRGLRQGLKDPESLKGNPKILE
jgi:hypothetical protein